MSVTLATAKQKIQYLESMIGFVDIDAKDHAILVGAINIYKSGNEPLYGNDDMDWLNRCVKKYGERLAKANEVVIGVADGEAHFPKGEKVISSDEEVHDAAEM